MVKDTLISITSYERHDSLENLLFQVCASNTDVMIWDDNSKDKKISTKNFRPESFHKFDKNYGKEEAWIKFNLIFAYLRQQNYKYYIFLPDDVEVCSDFVKKVINVYENIKDDKKVCLSFSHPNRCLKPCFTDVQPIHQWGAIKTQWTDMAFICEQKFIDLARLTPPDPDRWVKNPNLSSGVGSQLSHYFNNKYTMYNIKNEWMVHKGNDKSLMNPNIRLNEPL